MSTRDSPGAPAECSIERRTARETGRVSDRIRTRQPPQGTQPKTDAGGTRPIAGPRTGTTQSEPSVPASAGASGSHNETGSRPASACPAQPPSKAGGASPWGGKRHHGVGKADRSTESDRTGRGAAHHAGPRGTPERHTPATTKAHGQVPSNNGRRVPQTRRARTTRNEPRHEKRCQATPAAVRMDECTPGGYPAPAGYEQPPSGWTECAPRSDAPHTQHRTRNPQHNTLSEHTGEQEPSGPGHRRRKATHRAGTPVNRSQVVQDTAHTKQHTEWAHR